MEREMELRRICFLSADWLFSQNRDNQAWEMYRQGLEREILIEKEAK